MLTTLNHFLVVFFAFGLGLFACMLGGLEIGRRLGTRLRMRNPQEANDGVGVVDGAIFGVMGHFTFSGAVSRFDARRASIVQEANTIGTAYLRTKLLPAQSQPGGAGQVPSIHRSEDRSVQKDTGFGRLRPELQNAEVLEGEIWADAIAGCMESRDPAVKALVLGSLNEMFDMAVTRTEQSRMHPPKVIVAMLVLLVLACSLLAENLTAASRSRNWIQLLLFSITLTITVLIIM